MDNLELTRLKNTFKQKSTEELLPIWLENKRQEYPEEAFKIIKEILTARGVKIPKQGETEEALIKTDFSNIENIDTFFFPVSKLKLVIMAICTFGIYELFWFYKNWEFLKEKHNFKVRPFWRAVFSPFFCFSLFKIIKEYSRQYQVKADYKPIGLGVVYLLLCGTGKGDGVTQVISMLSILPLLAIQKAINNLNAKLNPNGKINSRFSSWNILGIILGSILWLLTIGGMTLPICLSKGWYL